MMMNENYNMLGLRYMNIHIYLSSSPKTVTPWARAVCKLVIEGHDYDVWVFIWERLLATKVVLMQSFEDAMDSLFFVMLSRFFSC
jgi:hypothetical protein